MTSVLAWVAIPVHTVVNAPPTVSPFCSRKNDFDSVNYLDDLSGTEKAEHADQAFAKMGEILSNIGIWESKQKAMPPAHLAIFLGILYNTISMTMELTGERRAELQRLIKHWIEKDSATLKEIQQILGKLNFACSTVRAG